MKTLKFLKHAGKYRLAYRPGESGSFEDKQANALIEEGFAVPADTKEELPADLPGRPAILKSGLTIEELKEVKDFQEIPGIGKATAEQLIKYFNPEK